MSGRRERIFEATLAEAARNGLAGLTLDAIAKRAGISRATLYRAFPGGRDGLIDQTVAWEVGRFLERLRTAVDRDAGVGEQVTALILNAHRLLEDHEVLQALLAEEGAAVLATIDPFQPVVFGAIRDELAATLAAADLAPGVDAGEAADYAARMVFSFVGTSGRFDLRDPRSVRRLVDEYLLAGVLRRHDS